MTLTWITSGSPAFLKSFQDPRLSVSALQQVRLLSSGELYHKNHKITNDKFRLGLKSSG
ncbi:hypothetical protein BN874_360018 [Candidatus Contendobacter odensis Run_B_J11]|uniref:Uncharacterized protein n=1 Tax=Candidatus Contendobacter odensis Run_B_J11 TaxID=1400861 RepID=A0A7U7GD43_9GAMM|nr:hypothetical protein BN874_360018 [Candidatus Contendobacter odensis Run_B_J11]